MNSKAITAEDFIQLKKIKSPQVSPDNNKCVYVLETVDETSNSYKSNIWIISPSGSTSPKLLTSGDRDSSPKWSPDGKYLAFLSSRNDKNLSNEEKIGPQLFLLPVDGGEAIQITKFPHGVKDFNWHPTELRFVVLTPISEEEINEINENKRPSFILNPIEAGAFDAKKKSKKQLTSDPRHITRMFYRQLNYYNDNRVDQLFDIDLSDDLYNSNIKSTLITSVDYFYGPGVWIPNGNAILSFRPKNGEPSATLDVEIVKINPTDKSIVVLGEVESVTGNLLPSNDNNLVFFPSHGEKSGDVHRNSRLFSLPLDESKALICYSNNLDRNFEQILMKDSSKIFGLSNENGTRNLYEVDIIRTNENIKKILSGPRKINEYHFAKDYIVFEISTENDPSELFSYNLSTNKEEKLTGVNENYLKNRDIAKSSMKIIESENNVQIQSWLLLPARHDGKSSLPVILEIHGGPAAMWSIHDDTMWQEFNYIVAQGYAVIFSNPRGSDGYGYTFRRAVHGKWGKLPAQDILAGLNYFLKNYEFLDQNRIGVTGGSYGGYMTTWLLGHYPDHFKAGVTQRGVYDFQSLALSTDIVAWFEGQYGNIWENLELYWKDSPISSVEKFQAPLLILHSDNDFRVPVTTSEQLFWACKRFNKTVQLVKYPREGHELSRSGEPRHRIDRLKRIVEWFNKYVK